MSYIFKFNFQLVQILFFLLIAKILWRFLVNGNRLHLLKTKTLESKNTYLFSFNMTFIFLEYSFRIDTQKIKRITDSAHI